jgi:DNA-binding NarL/FixJ family response regulator
MKPIRILLVDENPTFNRILSSFLTEQDASDLALVGTATEEEETTVLAYALQPEIILHDLGLPGLRGIPSIRGIRESLPNVGIIALTLFDSPAHRSAALQAGADDIVYKGDVFCDLVPAIHRVVEARSRKKIFRAPAAS